ncbi:MAG: DUF72 domain-containing protein [Flavobacteriales bacterium]|nr:DUF72 domain-containing protein [Flavobacteriales bacterium]
MKFGKVDDVTGIDLSLPKDHPDTRIVFSERKANPESDKPTIYVGCSRWSKNDLKGFYPRGTKDELAYYSTQFNAVELNASFYRIFPPEQFEKWKDKTASNFKFFPKIPQLISHYRQLNNIEGVLDEFIHSAIRLEDKLGTTFLQLNDRFAPNRFNKLAHFIELWPKDLPLTVEVRHTDWFNETTVADELFDLLHSNGVASTLVDTAGRRDLVHMRMTTSQPFVRYVGANHFSDYTRLNEWVGRIGEWIEQGMTELNFFIHQNIEEASPLLASHFIQLLNSELGYDLHVPEMAPDKKATSKKTNTLFD